MFGKVVTGIVISHIVEQTFHRQNSMCLDFGQTSNMHTIFMNFLENGKICNIGMRKISF